MAPSLSSSPPTPLRESISEGSNPSESSPRSQQRNCSTKNSKFRYYGYRRVLLLFNQGFPPCISFDLEKAECRIPDSRDFAITRVRTILRSAWQLPSVLTPPTVGLPINQEILMDSHQYLLMAPLFILYRVLS